jgi:hypothetical protein
MEEPLTAEVRRGLREFAEKFLTRSGVFCSEGIFSFELVTERRSAVLTCLVRVLS